MRAECPAVAVISPGREVRCTHGAGHSPAEDIHPGLVRVILPNSRELAASLVWSTSTTEWDEGNLARAT